MEMVVLTDSRHSIHLYFQTGDSPTVGVNATDILSRGWKRLA